MSSFSVRTDLEGKLLHCFFDDTALLLGDHIGEPFENLFGAQSQPDVRVFLELVQEKGIPDHLPLNASQATHELFLLSGICLDDCMLLIGVTYPARISQDFLDQLKQLNVQQLEVNRYFLTMPGALPVGEGGANNVSEELLIAQRKTTRLRKELTRHLTNSTMLNRLSTSLNLCDSLDELYKMVAVFTKELYETDTGSLFVFQPSTNQFEVRAHWGEGGERYSMGMSEDSFVALLNQQTSQQKITGFLMDSATEDTLLLRIPGESSLLGVLMVHLTRKVSSSDPVFAQFEQMFLRLIGLAITNTRYREWLAQDAMTDHLTSLYNRRFSILQLEREMNRALRQGSFLSLVMIDLDKFAEFVEEWGQLTANYYLIEFSHILARSVRKEDYACRYGESEFALILVDATQEDAIMILDRVKAECKGVLVAGHTMSIGFASGTATFPTDGRSPMDILRRAEEILYMMKRRKRSGKLRPLQ